MIHITGDMHGDLKRFYENRPYGEKEWSSDDILIVCGDFGFIFRGDEVEQSQLNELAKKDYNICFIDGNHENFPLIYQYPTVDYHGAPAHRIRQNIYHLIRGNIYEFENMLFFVMGGGYSRDRKRRQLGIDYWEEELPTSEEYHLSANNLKLHDMKVDYIITHTAPTDVIIKMGMEPDHHERELTGFLEWIEHDVDFKHWYFGHFHRDMKFRDKFSLLWYEVETITL